MFTTEEVVKAGGGYAMTREYLQQVIQLNVSLLIFKHRDIPFLTIYASSDEGTSHFVI